MRILISKNDPIIHMVAKPYDLDTEKNLIAEDCSQLLERFEYENRKEQKAIGLAAPQIGISRRMFVIQKPDQRPTIFINPKIIGYTGKPIFNDWEGCLTFPNQWTQVNRYRKIAVSYISSNSLKEVRKHIHHELTARVFQHELDHLDGITMYDRIDNPYEH